MTYNHAAQALVGLCMLVTAIIFLAFSRADKYPELRDADKVSVFTYKPTTRSIDPLVSVVAGSFLALYKQATPAATYQCNWGMPVAYLTKDSIADPVRKCPVRFVTTVSTVAADAAHPVVSVASDSPDVRADPRCPQSATLYPIFIQGAPLNHIHYKNIH